MTGVPMVENYIDTSDSFQKRMGEECWLGGRRSMRYPDGKLLITWGHDEMIMKQYLLTKKTWNGPCGKIGIVPKDSGRFYICTQYQRGAWERETVNTDAPSLSKKKFRQMCACVRKSGTEREG